MPVSRRVRLVLAAALAASSALPAAQAQGTITVAAGTTSVTHVAPGGKIGIPVVIDMSAAAGATNLASLTTTVSWGQTRLTFDSVQAGPFGSLAANVGNAAAGTATLALFNGSGTTATATFATMWFTAAASSGGTRVLLGPTVAADELAGDVLPLVLTRGQDVCVAPPGIWGDANADNAVNILDAQQIARFSVDLSVANVTAVAGRGDVTNDGTVNIIDAQQIARFSVGLTASTRVNTVLFLVPPVASMNIVPSAPSVAPGGSTQLTAVLRDATNAELGGCATVAWATSDADKATVDAIGRVTGVAPGSVVITASSSAQSAQVTVAVTANAAGGSVAVNAGNSQLATINTAVFVAPAVLVKDASNNPLAGARVTFAVTSGGGTATGVSATTNASGIATVGSWTVGPGIGTNTLTATVVGTGVVGNPVSFSATGTAPPAIAVSASLASFGGAIGAANPAPQVLSVTNGGTGTLSGLSTAVSYQSGQSTGWLTATLNTTTAPASVTLAATTGTLGVGTYNATVNIASTATGVSNSPRSVAVTFVVSVLPPAIVLSSSSVALSATAGGANPNASLAIGVSNGGIAGLSGLSADVTYQAGQPAGWLTATLNSASAPATMVLTAAGGALVAGTYNATVSVASSSANVSNSPQVIPVSFKVAAPGSPTLTSGSLVPGAVTQVGQVDQYTFAGQAGTSISLTLASTGGFTVSNFGADGANATATLYSPTGVALQTIRSNGRGDMTLTTSGTYLIRVNAANLSQTGSYNLGMQTRTSAGPVDAPMSCGSLTSGAIGAAGQMNLYGFTASANAIVSLTITTTAGFTASNSGADGANATAVLYSPAGVALQTLRSNSLQDVTLASAGVYSILVHAANLSRVGSYNLGLSCH